MVHVVGLHVSRDATVRVEPPAEMVGFAVGVARYVGRYVCRCSGDIKKSYKLQGKAVGEDNL